MSRPEAISFSAGDLTLAGELLLPEETHAGTAGRRPWVLLLPSWLPRDRDGAFDDHTHPTWFGSGPMAPPRPGLLARLAEALADQGVASFRFDPRGCGTSEGSWPRSNLFARIDDARDALAAMRGRRELDLARTGIVGHGEGATTALSIAIGDPAISALTLLGSSARSYRDVLRRGVAARARHGVDRAHPIVAAFDRAAEELIEHIGRHEPELALRLPRGEAIGLSLLGWQQAFRTPPMALATMLHRSVALVHGGLDVWSHPDESRLLAATLGASGRQPQLQVLPAAGHDLASVPDSIIAQLADDLARRIEPRDLPPVLAALQDADGKRLG